MSNKMPNCSFYGYIKRLMSPASSVINIVHFAPSNFFLSFFLSRWRHTTLMSWTSTAACGCRSACSWWGRRRASRRRSRPSAGPSCSCTATLTSSATSEAPRWCMRTRQAQTRKSRWGWGFCLFLSLFKVIFLSVELPGKIEKKISHHGDANLYPVATASFCSHCSFFYGLVWYNTKTLGNNVSHCPLAF